MKRPIVLDANSLAVRCIMASALEDLKAGETFTGGLYGALRSLRGYIADVSLYRAGPIYAFFDCGVPAFRKAALPGYKEHREERRSMLEPEQKDKAWKQIAAFERVLPLLGVRTFKYQNREADDGVAAACRILERQGLSPVVLTGDRDLLQLVSPRTSVLLFNAKSDGLISEDTFEDRVGCSRENYLLYKALVGDDSDGIKGAHGCGPSRAVQVITESPIPLLGPPKVQLRLLSASLREKPKLRKFEQSIVDDEARLVDVITGIDLSSSWGCEDPLTQAMSAPVSISKMPFLRFCSKYRFHSILGDPDNMLRPFSMAIA